MKKVFSTTLAAVAVVAALTFGAPAAASANAYPPIDSAQVSTAAVDPGGSVQLTVNDGVFLPGESLTITVTGNNARGITVTSGMVKFAVETLTYSDATANSAGGLDPLTLVFPEDASGAYNIAVFSSSSPGDTVTVTVGNLPVTGASSANLLGYWVGGGALLLAGGAIAVAATVHRQRKANA